MQIINRGFNNYSQEGIVTFSSNIITSLGEEPAATYYSVEENISLVSTALAALEVDISKGNAPGAADARATSKAALVTALDLLATALENTTPGDRAKLGTTGFELHKIPEPDHTPTGIPQNVRVETTGNPGEAKAICNATPHAATYESRATKDMDSGDFAHCPPSTSTRDLLFTNLETGVRWYFQIRAIGPNGPSPWSDVAVMMVV